MGATMAPQDNDTKQKEAPGGIGNFFRIFTYADRTSWFLNILAFITAIAAGTLLPLMNLLFGKFVTAFTNFAMGSYSPAQFRADVNKYTQVIFGFDSARVLTLPSRLYFVYLFIGKFVLFYTHTVAISIAGIRTTKALRVDFFRNTLRQNIAFFDAAKGGGITTRVTTNAKEVNYGIAEKLTLTIQGLSTLVTAFVVAFVVQWKLTLITLAIVPTIVAVIVRYPNTWNLHRAELDMPLRVAFSRFSAYFIYDRAIRCCLEISYTPIGIKIKRLALEVIRMRPLVMGICISIDQKNEVQMNEIFGKASQLAEEVLSTVRTVHSFWLHDVLSRKYDALQQQAVTTGLRKSPIYAVLFSTEFFCIYCGYALAFWRGIRMYVNGEIQESGDVITVIFAVIVAATAMTTIAPQVITIGKAASAAQALFETIDRQSEIDPMSDAGVLPSSCAGRIGLQDVNFAYPTRPDIAVLRGFSLSVPANKTTALVGQSGSGKSTIVGLLERWYDPSSGHITIDDSPIEELNLAWLRTNIRLVQQEPVLFSGTVFENVAYGLLGTEKAQLPEPEQRALVGEACKSAFADDFIKNLPNGYDTQVGERAMTLSGGQKQRLAIARSIISDPKVLLLDEATSALDPNAENIVQRALDSVSKDRTTIVIAHKLSTIRNADNIAVISQGLVSEQGAHDELMDKKGAYFRLVSAQNLGHLNEKKDISYKESTEKVPHVRSHFPGTLTSQNTQKAETDDGITVNFVKCVAILLGEHGHLWPCFVLLFVAAIVAGCTYPAQAILFSRVVKAFELPPENARQQGDFYSIMFFIVALGNLAAFATIGWFSNRANQHIARTYRLEIFQLLLRQDMSFFDKVENTSGALAAGLSTHPSSIYHLLGFNLMLVVTNVFSVFSSAVLAILVGWKLGVTIVFAALPPIVFSGYLRIRFEEKLEADTGERFASSAALASEAVSAIRTVSSLTLERCILEQYETRLDGIAQRSMKALSWTMFWYALTQSITFLGMALGFWYGGRLMSWGEYSTAQFYIVYIAVIFSGEAAASFFGYTSSFTEAATAANYIFRLRQLKPIVREDPSKPPFQDENLEGNGPTQMQVQSVSFAYQLRPTTSVLQDINVNVKPGGFIAFVGASGCGKSTLISLIERFYDPTSGRISSDGRVLVDLCPRKYRRHLSLVQQEPILYQGSIKDNVAMGIEGDATDAQIEEAMRQSNIYDFAASLPEGLATLCGARGTQLSGGQRQRIAIARALIRQPRLLLLDEATSALDTGSERIVQTALEKAQNGRTTIAVAHRLSTIKHADNIVVFSHGKIVETGTHTELLNKQGVYYDMCLGQGMDRGISV